jgi:TolA-binding protein
MRLLSVLIVALLALSCGERVPPADELIQKAESYYQQRKLVEALDSFQKFLKHHPRHERADRSAFMIGFIYANDLKDTLKGREAYESFLSGYPEADEGLRISAQWELAHLGRDIGDLDFLEEGRIGQPAKVEPLKKE